MDKNKQPDGVALLNKVIETNEATIEHYIMLLNSREAIVEMDLKVDYNLKILNANLEKSYKLLETEEEKRLAFLHSIPKSIETDLSYKANMQLQQFEKKSKIVKLVFYGMIASLLLSVLTTVGNIVLARQWYTQSIRSKSEIRMDILNEIRSSGQSIIEIEKYKQLLLNTDVMNKWIKKNPQDAALFLRFKDGYESK
jgi:hypothetical protein